MRYSTLVTFELVNGVVHATLFKKSSAVVETDCENVKFNATTNKGVAWFGVDYAENDIINSILAVVESELQRAASFAINELDNFMKNKFSIRLELEG